MVVVDTHTHVLTNWFEPVETLLYHMDANHVEQAVLIQDQPQTDNDYLFHCVRQYPGRFAPVVVVDLSVGGGVAQLERETERGASGIRLRTTSRSAGGDPLAIWRAANRLRLLISCSGRLHQYVDVVEHLGTGQLRTARPCPLNSGRKRTVTWHGFRTYRRRSSSTAWVSSARGLAAGTTVSIRGAGQSRAEPSAGIVRARAHDVGQRFSPGLRSRRYRNALARSRELFAGLNPAAVPLLFGDAAARIFAVR
jgi:hypothetical protein